MPTSIYAVHTLHARCLPPDVRSKRSWHPTDQTNEFQSGDALDMYGYMSCMATTAAEEEAKSQNRVEIKKRKTSMLASPTMCCSFLLLQNQHHNDDTDSTTPMSPSSQSRITFHPLKLPSQLLHEPLLSVSLPPLVPNGQSKKNKYDYLVIMAQR